MRAVITLHAMKSTPQISFEPLNWTDPPGYNKYTFPFILKTPFLFLFCNGHTSCFYQEGIKLNIPFLLPFIPLPSFPPLHVSHATSPYRSVLANSAPQSQMWMRGKRPATVRRTAQPPPLGVVVDVHSAKGEPKRAKPSPACVLCNTAKTSKMDRRAAAASSADRHSS